MPVDPTLIPVNGVVQTKWTAAATGNLPTALFVKNNSATKAGIQIDGTFGGATVALQGSNDGVDYFTLKDVTGTAISTTAAAYFEFSSSALYLKPTISGGTGDSIDIIIVMRGL